MKILVIAPQGMYKEYSSSFIHNQLKEIVKFRHKTMVIIPVAALKKSYTGSRIGKIVEHLKVDGIEIAYVRYASLSSLGEKNFNVVSAKISILVFCRNIIRCFQPDAIWSHTFGFGDTIGRSLKKYYNIPLMVTTHGGDTEDALTDKNISKTKRNSNEIDHIVCVSSKLKLNLEKHSIKNVSCIVNGFRIENIKTFDKKNFQITQVGHLIESKHYEITIQAVNILKKKGYNVALDIIGEGNKENELKKRVHELGLDDNVKFYGQLSNEETMKMMASSLFFVMPSYPEGLGIVYLEAMGSHCITIGTIGEGIDGIIRDGYNGFLVERDNYEKIAGIIENCIKNDKYSNKIAQNAYNTVMEYSWKNNALKNIEILKQIIK